MPLKRSIRLKQSPRLKKSTRSTKSRLLTGRVIAGSMALALIGVIAAVTLIGAHETPQPVNIANIETPLKKAPTQALAKKATTGAVAPDRVSVAPETLAAKATSADAPATESAVTANGPKSAPVTITGCLERDNETFRLKDTTGADAPKSRSWKSGFLRKGSASIDIVDAANRVRLPDHVGQRVSATGTLVDREMQVRSLKRVAASCDPA